MYAIIKTHLGQMLEAEVEFQPGNLLRLSVNEGKYKKLVSFVMETIGEGTFQKPAHKLLLKCDKGPLNIWCDEFPVATPKSLLFGYVEVEDESQDY